MTITQRICSIHLSVLVQYKYKVVKLNGIGKETTHILTYICRKESCSFFKNILYISSENLYKLELMELYNIPVIQKKIKM